MSGDEEDEFDEEEVGPDEEGEPHKAGKFSWHFLLGPCLTTMLFIQQTRSLLRRRNAKP